jgi:hypothetical protein
MKKLTKIDEHGHILQDIVNDDYIVTVEPVYNTMIQKEKNMYNLVIGEHLEQWEHKTT